MNNQIMVQPSFVFKAIGLILLAQVILFAAFFMGFPQLAIIALYFAVKKWGFAS